MPSNVLLHRFWKFQRLIDRFHPQKPNLIQYLKRRNTGDTESSETWTRRLLQHEPKIKNTESSPQDIVNERGRGRLESLLNAKQSIFRLSHGLPVSPGHSSAFWRLRFSQPPSSRSPSLSLLCTLRTVFLGLLSSICLSSITANLASQVVLTISVSNKVTIKLRGRRTGIW